MFLSNRTRVFSLDRRGSLLIEVLVSVVILSTALTLIIQSMTASLRSIRYGAGYTTALILLDNQISGMLRKGTVNPGSRETKNLTGPTGGPPAGYNYFMHAEPSDIVADNKIVEVDAAVAWRSGKKDSQISVTTFLSAASP